MLGHSTCPAPVPFQVGVPKLWVLAFTEYSYMFKQKSTPRGDSDSTGSQVGRECQCRKILTVHPQPPGIMFVQTQRRLMPKWACLGQQQLGKHIACAPEPKQPGRWIVSPTSPHSVVQTMRNGSVDNGLCDCVNFSSVIDNPVGHLRGAGAKFTVIPECETNPRVPEAPGTVTSYFNFSRNSY